MDLPLILTAVKGISVLVSPDVKTSQGAIKENYWKLNNLTSTQQERQVQKPTDLTWSR